jgi:glycosyltransferase involved in cell wall biosynthesis
MTELPHDNKKRPRIALVYHFWPHYRMAIARQLDHSPFVDYIFYSSGEDFEGILHGDMTQLRQTRRAPFIKLGKLFWQPKAISVAAANYDAIIYLGNPNFVSTWIGAILARCRGIPVLFWTHGWLRLEGNWKRRCRLAFLRLGKKVLVYSNRSKQIGVQSGFPGQHIEVIYNSLDVRMADSIVQQIEAGALSNVDPRCYFLNRNRPLVICTARLTRTCRFDLLLEAAQILSRRGIPLNILLVGDGPERTALEVHAQNLAVDVHFYGSCYDEVVLGQLIYHSDVTVSPGKIGLTAIHSLMYGTPAITHNDFDRQMPEVEAIDPGVTGALFHIDDPASLAETIYVWLHKAVDRHAIRTKARSIVHDKWNPVTQARIIDDAVREVVSYEP